MRTSKYEDIEEALFSWLKEKRALNIPINGTILMRKAENLPVLLGYNLDEFKISSGWLDRFKIRHNISFNEMSGESAKVSNESIVEWNKKLEVYVVGYKPEDIYNVDETGLFYKIKPNKTMQIKRDKCFNGEKSKDGLTLMFCCNMVGDNLVIGKSKNPRCFKNVRVEN